MKISIIGVGIYSIALAHNCAKTSTSITMWSENEDLIKDFNKTHTLNSITTKKIEPNITITNSFEETLKDTDLIIIGTTAKYVRDVCLKMKEYVLPTTPVCIASKGIENDTCSFLSDIVRNILKSKHIAVISGPTFAVDMLSNEPCALSLAVTSKKAEKTVQRALQNNMLKLRTNHDIYGTSLCGSIKNTIAIAAGILDGLGYNDSTKAFLITESIHDIKELLSSLECNPKTILSYAGIGDLLLTCSTNKSRNYKFGKLIGENKSQDELNKYLEANTTEGYYTLLSIKKLTKNRKIKMPIIDLIYGIVINHQDPKKLPEFLINKG